MKYRRNERAGTEETRVHIWNVPFSHRRRTILHLLGAQCEYEVPQTSDQKVQMKTTVQNLTGWLNFSPKIRSERPLKTAPM